MPDEFDFSTFQEPPRFTAAPLEAKEIPDVIINPSAPTLVDTLLEPPEPAAALNLVLENLASTDFSADDNKETYPFEPAFPEINDLVDVWYLLHPDVLLYDWQAQELLRISGYIDGTLDGLRVHFNPDVAYRAAYVTVNGSGKDMVLISTVAIGLPLLYKHVYVVITSASHEQLKYQTARHIETGIKSLNAALACDVYDSVEFYHRCEKRGGEIKLFVTDEAGRAEGWHPMHPRGRLVVIVNEAKSINSTVFDALDRCSGYSHWLEVSSPGSKRGLFYNNHLSAIAFPNLPQKGRFFTRKIHEGECPHKSAEGRLQMLRKHGEMSYVYQTSVLCHFFEQEEQVAIPLAVMEACRGIVLDDTYTDIGIGLDLAAGGDETSLYVRRGGRVIYKKFFRERDTERTADIIDDELTKLGLKFSPYEFNMDDGGLGKGIGDKLVRRGWSVIRRNNQSPSYVKAEYLNLGAEMYFHVRRLFEHKFIIFPDDPLTADQLSQRAYDETENQGKRTLESKKLVRARGGKSPDRADGYVLCFFSFRPDFNSQPKQNLEQKRLMTTDEFLAACARDPDFVTNLIERQNRPKITGDFTFQTGRV